MKEKKQDNLSALGNLQSWVIERTNPKTSYVIVDSPYHFGKYVFQGTKDQCEKFIEEQNEEHNTGQQQMDAIQKNTQTDIQNRGT